MSLESAPEVKTKKVNKRGFIIAATALAGLGALHLVDNAIEDAAKLAKIAKAVALFTPQAAPPLVVPDWIYPGSLETQAGATVLLDPTPAGKGFVSTLSKEAELPLVSKLAKSAFDTSTKYKEQNANRAPVGFLLVKTWEHAQEEMKSGDYRIAPGTNLPLEAARFASSGLTVFGTSWLDMETYQRIGILPKNLPPSTTVANAWWAQDGPGWNLYPRLFGDQKGIDPPGKEPARRGLERFMHAVGCAYLSTKWFSLKEADLSVVNIYPDLAKYNPDLLSSIPNAAKLAIDAGRKTKQITNNAQEAVFLAVFAGVGHEVKDTFSRNTYYDLIKGRRPGHGFLDDKVRYDIDADIYGALTGVNFIDMAREGLSRHKFMRITDDARFKNEGTSPYMQPMIRRA